jgi:hypothetical protein
MDRLVVTAKHQLVFDNGSMRLEHDKSDYERVIGPWSPAVKHVDKIISARPHERERSIIVLEYNTGHTLLLKIGRGTMELTPYHQKGGTKWLG